MMEDYAVAETCLKHALSLNEKDFQIHVNLGWIYLVQKQITASLAQFHIALGISDKQPKAHNNCGLCQIESGNYPEAIKHFRRALSQGTGDGPSQLPLGCAHVLNKDLDDAIKDWELSTKKPSRNTPMVLPTWE